jgi:hypothetical protein
MIHCKHTHKELVCHPQDLLWLNYIQVQLSYCLDRYCYIAELVCPVLIVLNEKAQRHVLVGCDPSKCTAGGKRGAGGPAAAAQFPAGKRQVKFVYEWCRPSVPLYTLINTTAW